MDIVNSLASLQLL